MAIESVELRFGDSQYSQPFQGADGHVYRVRRGRIEDAEQEMTYVQGRVTRLMADVTEEYAYALYDLNAQQWVTPYLLYGAMLIVMRNRGLV